MHIDIAPETERIVREELHSGHFRSVDDLILSGVQAWRERNAATATGPDLDARPISEVIAEIMADVPAEELSRLPKDGASEHDHYLYGWPKRNP